MKEYLLIREIPDYTKSAPSSREERVVINAFTDGDAVNVARNMSKNSKHFKLFKKIAEE